MVTVRQFSRGLGRTLRAMEREARRQERQCFIYEKAMAKEAVLEASATAAEKYQQLIDFLTGAHRLKFTRKDWSSIARAKPPDNPAPANTNEVRAADNLAAYRPGLFARNLGRAKKRRRELEAAMEQARSQDIESHSKRLTKINQQREEIAFAQALLSLQSQAIVAAVNKYANLGELPIEGISVLASDGRIFAIVDAFELDDMPTQSVSLLQSGKASMKAIAAGKLQELYRDNVCSSAIRVAAEFLQVLPIETVEVVLQADLLDRATGHIASQPIFYARIAAQALTTLNLPMTEATSLAERLGAHFEWSRKHGFRPLNLESWGVTVDVLAEGRSP